MEVMMVTNESRISVDLRGSDELQWWNYKWSFGEGGAWSEEARLRCWLTLARDQILSCVRFVIERRAPVSEGWKLFASCDYEATRFASGVRIDGGADFGGVVDVVSGDAFGAMRERIEDAVFAGMVIGHVRYAQMMEANLKLPGNGRALLGMLEDAHETSFYNAMRVNVKKPVSALLQKVYANVGGKSFSEGPQASLALFLSALSNAVVNAAYMSALSPFLLYYLGEWFRFEAVDLTKKASAELVGSGGAKIPYVCRPSDLITIGDFAMLGDVASGVGVFELQDMKASELGDWSEIVARAKRLPKSRLLDDEDAMMYAINEMPKDYMDYWRDVARWAVDSVVHRVLIGGDHVED